MNAGKRQTEVGDHLEANARLTGTVAIVLLLPLALVLATGLAVHASC